MQIDFNNIGPIDKATWTPAKLNVIAGPNGSGKTYLAHAIYTAIKGMFSLGSSTSVVTGLRKVAGELHKNGAVTLDLLRLLTIVKDLKEDRIQTRTRPYISYLNVDSTEANTPSVFLTIDQLDIADAFFGGGKSAIRSVPTGIEITLHPDAKLETVRLELVINDKLDSDEAVNVAEGDVEKIIERMIGRMLDHRFASIAGAPYVLTAERTGISLFHQDIDFGRSQMIESLRAETYTDESEQDSNSLPNTIWSPAVEDNFNQFRSINRKLNRTSFLSREHPEVIQLFDLMVSGEFRERDGRVSFTPLGAKAPIPLTSTSSTVRSLYELGIFLKHIARRNQWLIVDEPELNLHPNNQILMARLLTAVSQAGVKVLITTHSDYIIRELSILTLLEKEEKSDWPADYENTASLRPDDIRVDYTEFVGEGRRAELLKAEISEDVGIVTPFFDEVINRQNDNLDQVLWG